MRLKYIFLVFFCINLLPINAFVFKQYNSLNGLSNDNVYDVVQDKEGYIWIATSMGLNRLGPNGIKNYYTSDGLYTNIILSLDIDENNIVWFGTTLGLCAFENGVIVKKMDNEFINAPIELIVKLHFIYYVDQSGHLFRYNREEMKLDQIFDTKNVSDEGPVRKICRSKDGSVLAATYNGLYRLTMDRIEKLEIENLKDSSFLHVQEASDGVIWLTSASRVYSIKDGRVYKTFSLFGSSEVKIKNVAPDSYNKLWYSGIANNPFLYMNHRGNKYDINYYLGMSSVVNSIFIDKNDDVWFGTFGKGVYVLRNEPYDYYDSHKGLSTNFITDVNWSKNAVFVGTNISFNYKLNSDSIFQEVKYSKNGNTEYVRNIIEFKNKYLISIYNQELSNNIFFSDDIGSDQCFFFNGRYVYGDDDVNIVIADLYNDSLNIFDFKNNTFKIRSKVDLIKPLGEKANLNRIVKIENHYFICTRRGLMVIDSSFKKNNTYLKNLAIYDAVLYNSKLVLSGEFGLIIYTFENKTYQLVGEANKKSILPTSLALDKRNRLWVGTTNGVYVYSNNSIDYIGSNEGLPSIHISNFSYNEASNDIWLSTYDGIVVIDLDSYDSFMHRKNNNFIIEEIIVDDKIYLPIDSGLLKFHSRHLQIKTALFNFVNNKGYSLRYRIDVSPWINVQGNSINISYIKPGLHEIEIQSLESVFAQSSSVKLSFYIIPYWYERLWLKLLVGIVCILILSLLVFIIVKINSQKADRKIAFERKVMDLKMQALNAAINSHFVFNVLNAIQYFVSSKQDIKASKFIADFARFMRIIIDNSNMTIIPISEEIKRIHLYIGLESMRFEDRLSYQVEIDETINQEEIMIPNMVIQPFVENSILHGILASKDKGNISIQLRDLGKSIQLIIIDDGIGINAARQKRKLFNKKSIGLKNVIQRLELFSGDDVFDYKIIDRSIEGSRGTKVEIVFSKISFEDL